MMHKVSNLFQEAQKHLVGGVNSPVRAFKAVGGEPFLVRSAEGAKLIDVDGHEYLDYVMSWGAQILGHGYSSIIRAVALQLQHGTSYGAATYAEVELAMMIKEAFPSIDKVRLVSSGTEAAMSAIRLARGFTGRKKILKFNGCYHGHSDSLLVKAGSGGATFGVPDSAGIPEDLAKLTLTLEYNDIPSLEKLFKEQGSEIACVLVEPVAANMGLINPQVGFLEKLRELCDQYESALVFDEVISGFRVALGGAQELYGIRADITCLGKIIGGGLPMAAFGGREDMMNCLSPEGPVYQAGTLSGNPLATAAGIEVMKQLADKEIYQVLEERTSSFVNELKEFIREKKYPIQINRQGSLFTLFFNSGPVIDFKTSSQSNAQKYAQLFQLLLKKGFFFPPSSYEACFVSLAHHENDLHRTIVALKESFKEIFGY